MPGKLYDGRDVTTVKNGVPQNSKAYCEGALYRTQDTAANHPKTDNPHQSGSELATAWDAGWDLADTYAGSTIPGGGVEGPCALEGIAVPPAL